MWRLLSKAKGTRGGGGHPSPSLLMAGILGMLFPLIGTGCTIESAPEPGVESQTSNTSMASQQQSIRVMPLGDSITDGYNVPGGYRINLWAALEERGDRIEFVGNQENGPPELPDRNHQGHSGWRIDELHRRVGDWLETAEPDVILLLIGTNDIVQGHSLDTAPARLNALIDELFRHRPQAQIFVGSIPPIDEVNLNARVEAYNQAIAQNIQARQSQGDRLTFVDLYSGLTPEDLADGIHPNRQGHDKIAQMWYEAWTQHH